MPSHYNPGRRIGFFVGHDAGERKGFALRRAFLLFSIFAPTN
jgi:hypothetical protein